MAHVVKAGCVILAFLFSRAVATGDVNDMYGAGIFADAWRGTGTLHGAPGECIHCHLGTPGSDETSGAGLEGVAGGPSTVCMGCHDGIVASEVPFVTAAAIGLPAERRMADHPVGVPMALSGNAGMSRREEVRGMAAGDRDGTPVWWIDTEPVPNGRRDATDLPLFTRMVAGRPVPFVECPTCHDPHAAGEGAKLRTRPTLTRLCTACHAV